MQAVEPLFTLMIKETAVQHKEEEKKPRRQWKPLLA
jgi:hypothetical protein